MLILDDLHWAEPAFLDLVEDVASTSREASLLVICLARPELLEHRPGFGGGMPNSSSLLLEPLDEADSERLVDHLLGASDLPDVVRAHIVSIAEGNPLFVEELLATLVERSVLRRTDGRWTTTETVIPVPASIQALIAARIDRLRRSRATRSGARVDRGQALHAGARRRARSRTSVRCSSTHTSTRSSGPSSSGRAPTATSRSGTS